MPSLARADPLQGRQPSLSFRFSGVVLVSMHPSAPFREATTSAIDWPHSTSSQVTRRTVPLSEGVPSGTKSFEAGPLLNRGP